MQFSDYQNLTSSEKITLARLSAAKRLMGWSVHAGSVYKLENFEYKVLTGIEDSGTAYTVAANVGAVTAGKYYLDTSTSTLYIRTTGSDNPNGRFIVALLEFHFANVPIVLPYDLDTGAEVFFEPLVKSTSEFGVGIDTVNQTSEALEGAGSLTFFNDHDFWPANFDKLSFENQRCYLYAYHRDLDPSDARLIFKGRVDKQSYSADAVTFQLKDQFAELRSPVPMSTIGDLDERTSDDLAEAKQRMIFGSVYGNVPTNIDQVVDGYPVTGTVTVAYGDTAVAGSGTAFLSELSPDDQIVLDGENYTIASISSDTALVLTSAYAGDTAISAAATYVLPERPKRYMNRVFKVAGHALREPVTTAEAGGTIRVLFVASTRDIYAGDVIYIGDLGSGEIATVEHVIGDNYIRLTTSLATVPAEGTAIRRPAIQNVRIGNVPLTYYRDYTFNASTAVLTLSDDAEANAAPIYQLGQNMTFSNGSRTVTGSGFQAIIQPGYMVGVIGQADFFEVLSVDSDTSLTLRSASTFSATAGGRYKSLIYDPDETVLSLDCLGRTVDGLTTGTLIKTAPAISKALLGDAGLTAELDTASFTSAESIAYQELGLVIPSTYDDTDTPTYRDVLNKVNKSVLGALVQDADFKFAYQVLRPSKTTAATRFSESDVLSFSLNSTAENIVKTAIVEYRPKEHDYVANTDTVSTQQKTSDRANYVIKTERTRTISTLLANQADAEIMANRWAFLLEATAARLSFSTKLQGITLEVGDIIEIEHRKFFERFGGDSKRRLFLVEAVNRSGSAVKIEATDLSNAFNRVASINSISNDWTTASEDERLYGGFITDEYGLINNDPDSSETNLIW
jgi:hypothetical protein